MAMAGDEDAQVVLDALLNGESWSSILLLRWLGTLRGASAAFFERRSIARPK
jgi:hypothetical protein